MKNWNADDWAMIVLASAIPLSVILIGVIRIVTGEALSDNSTEVLKVLMASVGAGVLAIIAGRRNSKNQKEEPK